MPPLLLNTRTAVPENFASVSANDVEELFQRGLLAARAGDRDEARWWWVRAAEHGEPASTLKFGITAANRGATKRASCVRKKYEGISDDRRRYPRPSRQEAAHQDIDLEGRRRMMGHWLGISAALVTGSQPLIFVGSAVGEMIGRLTIQAS